MRLSPLYTKYEILEIKGIYKLEVTKYMTKLKHKKLPEAFETNFETCSTVHSHFTCSVKSQKFYQCSHSNWQHLDL